MASNAASGRMWRLVRAFAVSDGLSLSRDLLFAFMILLPVIVAFVLRFYWPQLETVLAARLEFDLAQYRPMMMGTFVTMSGGLIGGVYGLVFVEERDDKTLAALRVTPVSFARILTARLIAPVILAVVTTIISYPVADLTPLPIWIVALIALSGAAIVPPAALAVIAFAPSKLAGLVAFRLVNTFLALPALAFIVSWPVTMLAWPWPSYWPMQALWRAAEGELFWPYLLVGPVISAILAWLLYRRLLARAEP